ncbi:MAG: META domain-containing protein [Actinomycetota bacterium]
MDRRRLATASVAVMLFALTGCAAREQAGNVGPTNDPTRSLDGRAFISQRVSGHELVAGTEIRLTFDDGRLGAAAGCNSLGAPYSIDDDDLVIAEGMSMTEMGCDPARHEQDEWLADFLTSEPTIVVDGDELTLEGTEATIELLDREVADPDRELIGSIWRVDTVLDSDSASSVAGIVTLEFLDDRSFKVTAKDCTSATGSMEITDETISFDDFAVDDIGCPLPWQETLDVLRAGNTTYSIEASRLEIEAGSQGIGAVAQP